MSTRPSPVVGQVQRTRTEDRLRAVLAAGLERFSKLSAAATGVGPFLFFGDEEEEQRTYWTWDPVTKRILEETREEWELDPPTKRFKVPEKLVNRLKDLPLDVQAQIFANEALSCRDVKRLCTLNTSFRALCTNETYWRWQCHRFDWDRDDRFDGPWPAPEGQANFSWRAHYDWWCVRVHTNATLEDAVRAISPLFTNDNNNHPWYGHISTWDTSRVTDMRFLFADNYTFTGDIGRWDVSRVTNMAGMFKDANVFDGDLALWNVSRVTNMASMFQAARNFKGDLSRWPVGNVTTMEAMFYGASDFNSNIANWKVGNVRNMSSMFHSARTFNQDLSTWRVGAVTNTSNMFAFAHSFTSDLKSWNVSEVRFMNGMFWDALVFTSDLSGWDVGNVTYMNSMFRGAQDFNSDLSTWNLSSLQGRNLMFQNAASYNPAEGYGLGERFQPEEPAVDDEMAVDDFLRSGVAHG